MGLFMHEDVPTNGVNFAEQYQKAASDDGNGLIWYGSPMGKSTAKGAISVDSEGQVCVTSLSFSGENNSTHCRTDSFIHLQTQAISPFGIIHSGMYQMPIIGTMAALLFVGIMKWLKLKSKVTTE